MPGDPFYASKQWRAARAGFLRDNPMCSVRGCPEPACRVDHKLTRRERPDLAFDRSNFQAFCATHDSQKTYRQDRPAYARSDKPLMAQGSDATGMPLSPDHHWNR